MSRRFSWIVLLGLIVTLVIRASFAEEGKLVPVVFPGGTTIQAEVADTEAKRRMGLMFRESLAPDRGMLFVYPKPGIYPFWMKNCRFPIDILWLAPDKRIVRIIERVPPCPADPCPNYNPRVEALYVIEVSAGFAQREGLKTGSPIRF
jgi:uncharacterized membrane protein (UPF0127 family)